jgi:hypothetical protein
MLSAYLDEALPSNEMSAVKNLLAKDADLRDALKRLKSLRTGLKSLPTLTPPESFYDRVWRDVERTPVRRPFFSYVPFKTIGALAVVSLVVVATRDFWRPEGSRRMSLSPLQMFQSSLKAGQAPSAAYQRKAMPMREAAALESEVAEKKDKAIVPSGPRADSIRVGSRMEKTSALKQEESSKRSLAAPAGGISISGGLPGRAAGFSQGDLPIFSKLRGGTSGVKDFQEVMVRTEAEWNELWSRHSPGRPVPRFDFSRVMIAGVFMGQKPAGGYSVEIQKVQAEGGRIRIIYHVTEPASGTPSVPGVAAPFHIVVLPRVEGAVKFESK